jgi:hypothetical protein
VVTHRANRVKWSTPDAFARPRRVSLRITQENLQKGNSELAAGQKGLEAEVAALDKQVTRLEDQAG